MEGGKQYAIRSEIASAPFGSPRNQNTWSQLMPSISNGGTSANITLWRSSGVSVSIGGKSAFIAGLKPASGCVVGVQP